MSFPMMEVFTSLQQEREKRFASNVLPTIAFNFYQIFKWIHADIFHFKITVWRYMREILIHEDSTRHENAVF